MARNCLTVYLTELSEKFCHLGKQMQNTARSPVVSFYVGHSLCTVMDLSLPKTSL